MRGIRLVASVVATAFVFLLSLSAHADLYVATNGSDSASRNTWPTAYTNIQDALDAAGDSDNIYIAGHTFALTNELSWISGSGVTIIGGYEATNTVSLGSNNPALWPTIISRDTNYTTRIIWIESVTNGTLEKVTITGGYIVGDGGGILASNCQNISLLSCIISNNLGAIPSGSDNMAGGGLFLTGNSSAVVSNCLVAENTLIGGTRYNATYGGGIYVGSGSSATLTDSTITRNLAHIANISQNDRSLGGGIYSAGNTTIRNCLITRNEADHNTANADWQRGDGIYCNGGTLIVENCTIAYSMDQGIYRAAGNAYVTNSIMWDNGDDIVGTVNLSHCNIQDGDQSGTNDNISADPLFEYGYYLASGSPCINAGTNAAYLVGSGYTTETGGSDDSGDVDMGYHYRSGVDTSLTDLYVSPTGSDGNSGTNWAQAKLSISAALTLATDGTTVHVASGNYTNGLETFPLSIIDKRGVSLLGTNQNDTIINASGSGQRILTVDRAPETMIEGFTITGGSVTGDGGGISVTYSEDTSVLSCSITNNQATRVVNYTITHGGGILFDGQSTGGTVSNCNISGNMIVGSRYIGCYGGGLYVGSASEVAVLDCTFLNNFAYLNSISAGQRPLGGAIYSAGNTTVRNCLLAKNECRHNYTVADWQRGDGLYCNGGNLVLENCTVAYNLDHGIYRNAGNVYATNCVIWSNGDDIVGTVNLSHCTVQDGDQAGSDNNIASDPLLEYGYYLAAGSPCIDSGINAAYLVSNGYVTRATGTDDSGVVDMGYHYTGGFDTSYSNLYVSPSGSDINSGTNWAQAKESISAALAVATHGSKIHIASGNYTNGLETFPLTIDNLNGVQLLGTNMNDTVIDASGSARQAVRMTFAPGAVIEGLTITGGQALGHGGGIFMDTCPGNSRITSCIISNNETTARYKNGGGIYIDGMSEVTVSNTLIVANRADDDDADGGGIAIAGESDVTMIECAIATNRAVTWHGHIYGGGVYNAATLLMRNCVIVNNRADNVGAGGEIYKHGDNVGSVGAASMTILENCTIAGNTTKGIECAGGTMIVSNCIVWGHADDLIGTIQVSKSVVSETDILPDEQTIHIDPLFADAIYYHLESRGGHYAGGYFFGGYWTNSTTTNSPLIDRLYGDSTREPQPNGRVPYLNMPSKNWGGYGNTPVASKTFLEEPGVFTNLTVHSYGVTGLGTNFATMNGEVVHLGGGPNPGVFFCWGYSDGGTAATSAWEFAQSIGTKAQWELFDFGITNLLQGTTYYYRCYVTNSSGSDWSADPAETFIPVGQPVITNTGSVYVWDRRAELRGTVSDSVGEDPNIWFYYWVDGGSSTSIVDIGSQGGDFASVVIDLDGASLYHYQILASNTAGALWSMVRDFNTRASPTEWYVSQTGDGTWGTNWSTAITTIQVALDIARSNDTIYVAGQHFGRWSQLIWSGSSSWVTVKGSYQAANDSQRPGPFSINTWPTSITPTSGVDRVMLITNVTGGTMERLVVRGGYVPDNGAGLCIIGSTGISVLSSWIATNQTTGSNRRGGGIFVDGNSDVVVSNCVIRGNYAGNDYNVGGGGICLNPGSTMAIYDSQIVTNRGFSSHSGLYGGAIRNHGTMYLRNCLLWGNWIIYGGGNETYEHGDAIYSSVGSITLDSCTIANNPDEGLEIGSGTMTLTNCIVWNNGDDILVGGGSVTLDHCNIEDGDNNGTNGCISVDPLFAGASTNNFRLQETSPCLDVGTNVAWITKTVLDLDGNLRLNNRKVDLGAYEYQQDAKGTVIIVR